MKQIELNDRAKSVKKKSQLYELPKFYTIVPAVVRYDRNLKDLDKIIYSEIVALSHVHGYCYASNSYFCKVFNYSESTVKRAISNLETCGYITRDLDSNKGDYRRLYVNTQDSKAVARINNLLTLESISEEKNDTTTPVKIEPGTPVKIDPTPGSNMSTNYYKRVLQDDLNNARTRNFTTSSENEPNIKELFSKVYKGSRNKK